MRTVKLPKVTVWCIGLGAGLGVAGSLLLKENQKEIFIRERLAKAAPGAVTCEMSFCPKGEIIAIGIRPGGVILFDLKKNAPVSWLAEGCPNIETLSFSDDGEFLAAGTATGELWIWKRSGLLYFSEKVTNKIIHHVSFFDGDAYAYCDKFGFKVSLEEKKVDLLDVSFASWCGCSFRDKRLFGAWSGVIVRPSSDFKTYDSFQLGSGSVTTIFTRKTENKLVFFVGTGNGNVFWVNADDWKPHRIGLEGGGVPIGNGDTSCYGIMAFTEKHEDCDKILVINADDKKYIKTIAIPFECFSMKFRPGTSLIFLGARNAKVIVLDPANGKMIPLGLY